MGSDAPPKVNTEGVYKMFKIVYFHDRANEFMVEESAVNDSIGAWRHLLDPNGTTEGILFSHPYTGVLDVDDNSKTLNARAIDTSVITDPSEVERLITEWKEASGLGAYAELNIVTYIEAISDLTMTELCDLFNSVRDNHLNSIILTDVGEMAKVIVLYNGEGAEAEIRQKLLESLA